ncbi:MAG: hypothetical protein GXO54_05335 [Chloroflexi bacterium]|nr:hypothetical protein [Chloroflexota bacterium]
MWKQRRVYEGMLDGLILLALIWAGVKFSWDLPRWYDIPTFDEAEMLRAGVELTWAKVSKLKSEWSPLYVFWYAFLNRVARPESRVALHDLNWRILAVLASVGLYAVLRRYRIARIYAAGLALFALLSRLVWFDLTRSVLLAVVLTYAAAWAATWPRQRWKRLWVGGWLLGLAAFARPEYAFPAMGLVLFAGVDAARAWKRRPWRWTSRDGLLLVPVVLPTIGIMVWGLPFGHGRSVYAFGQHFAFNLWMCLGQPETRTWEEEVEAAFGSIQSIAQAVWRNPTMFAQHVLCNLKRGHKVVGQMVIHAPWSGLRYIYEAGATLLAWALGTLWVLARHRTRCRRRWLVGWGRGDLLFWSMVAAALLAPIVIISSLKPHYRAQFGWAWLTLWAYLCLPRQYTSRPWYRTLLLAALLIAVTPPTMAGLSAHPSWYPTLYNRSTVQAIARITASEPGPIVVSAHKRLAHYFLISYLDSRFEIGRRLPQEGALAFIQRYRPDILIVHFPWYDGDDSWRVFREHPEAYGYWMYPIGKQRALYVRSDRFPPPSSR